MLLFPHFTTSHFLMFWSTSHFSFLWGTEQCFHIFKPQHLSYSFWSILPHLYFWSCSIYCLFFLQSVLIGHWYSVFTHCDVLNESNKNHCIMSSFVSCQLYILGCDSISMEIKKNKSQIVFPLLVFVSEWCIHTILNSLIFSVFISSAALWWAHPEASGAPSPGSNFRVQPSFEHLGHP